MALTDYEEIHLGVVVDDELDRCQWLSFFNSNLNIAKPIEDHCRLWTIIDKTLNRDSSESPAVRLDRKHSIFKLFDVLMVYIGRKISTEFLYHR